MVTFRVFVAVIIRVGTDFFPPGGGPSALSSELQTGASKLSETQGAASEDYPDVTLLAMTDSCKREIAKMRC